MCDGLAFSAWGCFEREAAKKSDLAPYDGSFLGFDGSCVGLDAHGTSVVDSGQQLHESV